MTAMHAVEVPSTRLGVSGLTLSGDIKCKRPTIERLSGDGRAIFDRPNNDFPSRHPVFLPLHIVETVMT